ncbi:MAG: hypothetical protein WCD86_14615, partial [Ktedonobacteraceae bacterium]
AKPAKKLPELHKFNPTPAYLENILRTMKHIVQQWQAEYDWMKSIREQELEQMNAPRSTS